MSCAVASRSHRGSTTTVAPMNSGPFMLPDMPVTWNSGSTARYVESCVRENHCAPPTSVLMALRWVCMQPLGWPVVPDV